MEATARVTARVSLKHSIEIAKAIRGKNIDKALKFLNNLIERKVKLPCGRYHPTAAKEIRDLIENAKANAENKGMSTEKLFIKEIKTNKGPTFRRPRSRWKLRGRRAKICHLEVTLGER